MHLIRDCEPRQYGWRAITQSSLRTAEPGRHGPAKRTDRTASLDRRQTGMCPCERRRLRRSEWRILRTRPSYIPARQARWRPTLPRVQSGCCRRVASARATRAGYQRRLRSAVGVTCVPRLHWRCAITPAKISMTTRTKSDFTRLSTKLAALENMCQQCIY